MWSFVLTFHLIFLYMRHMFILLFFSVYTVITFSIHFNLYQHVFRQLSGCLRFKITFKHRFVDAVVVIIFFFCHHLYTCHALLICILFALLLYVVFFSFFIKQNFFLHTLISLSGISLPVTNNIIKAIFLKEKTCHLDRND